METTLGRICSFYSGTGFPVEYQGKKAGEYPFYKVGDISKNVVSGNVELKLCDNYIDWEDVKNIHGTIVPAGTIVFAKIGEAVKLNRRAITSNDCLVDNNVIGVKPNIHLITLQYCYHFLSTIKMEKYAESTTVPSVKKSVLEKIPIFLPSIEEQNAICSELNKVSKLISLRKKQLQKLDDLVKSRFVEMFANEKHTMQMNEVCAIITDGTHQPPHFVGEGIPFIFVSNLTGNQITYEAEKFIDQSTYDELIKRTPIEIGDVLLSTVGSYGHPAVVKKKKKFLFQRHIAYLKPRKELVDSDYLHGAILSPDVQRQIENGVKGIAQKTLNLSEIKKLTIPVPDINRQKDYSAFTAEVEKTKLTVQQGLDKLELLKQSLMQKYFGGEQ